MGWYALQLHKKRASNSNISQSAELINQTEEKRFFQKNQKAFKQSFHTTVCRQKILFYHILYLVMGDELPLL